MNYQERINAKIKYSQQRTIELKSSSERFFKKGFCENTGIPLGQPILIGHHSETRHRNAIKKYDRQMEKALNDENKAEYHIERVERLQNGIVISSDDPEAIRKLKEKINKLQTSLDLNKKLNMKLRKFKTRSNAIKEVNKLSNDNPDKKHFISMLETAKYWTQPPERIRAYYYSTVSDNAEIRRLNDRIKHLESIKQIPETEEKINNVTLKIDKEVNRIKLFFPDIPNLNTRTKLKQNGFHWSRFNKCWQRQINKYALRIARDILKETA